VHQSGLDAKLLELVKLRASLINGCAYCVDMHTKVARSLGETEQRLYEVGRWREAPFYTERERAALAWTEAVCVAAAVLLLSVPLFWAVMATVISAGDDIA